jgi:signal transduction histidine kinase
LTELKREASITPLSLSHFWHQRIYEVAFLLSLAVIALFSIPLFTNVAPTGLFSVGFIAVVAAGATALTSVAFYFIKQKNEHFFEPLIVLLFFASTVGILVAQTGGVDSAFLMLWLFVAFFSGIFAFYGWLPIVLATAAFIAMKYLDDGFDPNVIAVATLGSLLPVTIGAIIWHNKPVSGTDKNIKNLTNELSEVTSQSEIIINAIGDGVIAVDGQGTVRLINPAAQGLLGWVKQDALMLNYKSILKMTDLNNKEIDPTLEPVLQVLNTNQQVRSSTLILLAKSGKKITSSLVISPIEFISTASHEMRTPVAAIEGYLGLALNPSTAQIDDKARDFIMKAHEAAQHLGRLFQDLLDVSKSEDGRLANTPKVVDITAYTETIVQGLAQKATEKSLALVFKPTDNNNQKTITPVYFVNQDNDHIREILDNLIENAIKYTPEGTVTVDVTGTDSKVIVSVKDSGLGIPAEDVTHLFQKFYRVDNADRQQIGGTGLGLYLSRRLAEAMQGRLYLESVHGTGSTFSLELPRVDNQEAEQLKRQQETARAAAAAQVAARPQVAVPDTSMPPAIVPRPASTSEALTPAASTTPTAATTVPRGESLSREQIMAHVQKLEAMSQENQPVAASAPVSTTQTKIPVTSPEPVAPPQAGQ